MAELRYFRNADGQAPFADWFARQDPVASFRVTRALTRLEQGNSSNVKSVGEAVLELRIDFGPGYRIYFGRDGDSLVILLIGGTKVRQQRDIETAQRYWRDYKRQKRERP
jgi:putative addiction module killer protein